jgi:hypothetical protein
VLLRYAFSAIELLIQCCLAVNEMTGKIYRNTYKG